MGIKGDDAQYMQSPTLAKVSPFHEPSALSLSLPHKPSLRLLVAIPGQSFELKGWLIINTTRTDFSMNE